MKLMRTSCIVDRLGEHLCERSDGVPAGLPDAFLAARRLRRKPKPRWFLLLPDQLPAAGGARSVLLQAPIEGVNRIQRHVVRARCEREELSNFMLRNTLSGTLPFASRLHLGGLLWLANMQRNQVNSCEEWLIKS